MLAFRLIIILLWLGKQNLNFLSRKPKLNQFNSSMFKYFKINLLYSAFISSMDIRTISCFTLSTPMTSHPAFAKDLAITDPMAPAKPVTSAVLPWSSISIWSCKRFILRCNILIKISWTVAQCNKDLI